VLIRIARGELLAATEVYRRRLRVVLGPGRAFLVPTEDAVGRGRRHAGGQKHCTPSLSLPISMVNTNTMLESDHKKEGLESRF